MKKAMISYIKQEADDEFYTPDYAIMPLLKYIPKEKVIWCPFDTEDSNFVKIFRNNGYKVIYSHINNGEDFFTYEPKENYDVIVSNPPYSLKTEVLKRCYQLNKPFALLLPITSLEGVERNKLYRKFGVQLLVFDRRINFKHNNDKKTKTGSWFNAIYFCWKLLPNDLIFEELDY